MSEENVEIIRRLYETVVATLEMPMEPFASEFEFDNSDVSPEQTGVVLGVKAAEGSMRPYWEAFDDFQIEVAEVIHADAERVVDVVRDGGRIRGSNAQITNRFIHVWTFADGKIIRLSIHADRDRALEAAGLTK